MSLLDNGPDTILIWPETTTQNDRGSTVRVADLDAEPIRVACRVQPVSSDESAADGENVSTLYRAIAREFPGGAWARIRWDGRDWDEVGEPERRNGSARTRHVSILMRARKPQGAPNG